jgi:hypothetical protein
MKMTEVEEFPLETTRNFVKLQSMLKDIQYEIIYKDIDDVNYVSRAIDILYSKVKILHKIVFKEIENDVYCPSK